MPFTKGDPNINRNGRPKGSLSITAEIKKKLEEIPEGEEKTNLEQLIDIIINRAVKEGDDKMVDRLWKFVDGLPKQSIDAKVDLPGTLIQLIGGVTEQGENNSVPEEDQE